MNKKLLKARLKKDLYGYSIDMEEDREFVANELIKKGWVNIKELAKLLRQEFFFMKTTASKDAIYQFTDSQLDRFIKEYLKDV